MAEEGCHWVCCHVRDNSYSSDIVVEVEEVLYKYTSVSLYEMRSIELQEICF